MKFEKRMKYGQKMLEENVRRPFVNWYKKVKRIIDKLPDETEVYGVSIIFDTDQNLNNAQEMDKLKDMNAKQHFYQTYRRLCLMLIIS